MGSGSIRTELLLSEILCLRILVAHGEGQIYNLLLMKVVLVQHGKLG